MDHRKPRPCCQSKKDSANRGNYCQRARPARNELFSLNCKFLFQRQNEPDSESESITAFSITIGAVHSCHGQSGCGGDNFAMHVAFDFRRG